MSDFHHLHRAVEVRAPLDEDQSEDAGIGSVLLICVAFLAFALLCVWAGARMSGASFLDVLAEIWAAGRR